MAKKIEEGDTFIIYKEKGKKKIKCTVCGYVSYNPNDVREKYCGHCHCHHPVTVIKNFLDSDE
jgi:ribosomal protein L37E